MKSIRLLLSFRNSFGIIYYKNMVLSISWFVCIVCLIEQQYVLSKSGIINVMICEYNICNLSNCSATLFQM